MIGPPLPASNRCVSFPPSESWHPGPSTSNSLSRLSLTTARPATSRARPPTMSATPPGPMSPLTGRFTPAVPARQPIAVRYMNGRTTSRLAFLADRPGFVWRGGEPRGTIDTLVFAKLKALQHQSVAGLRRFGLPAPGFPGRDRPPTRTRGRPHLSGLERPGQARQARRSADGTPRVRRFLGAQVGRPAS